MCSQPASLYERKGKFKGCVRTSASSAVKEDKPPGPKAEGLKEVRLTPPHPHREGPWWW